MTLRILHVASHQINVGDGALIGVIQARLRALSDRPVDFTDFDIVDLEPEYGGATLPDLSAYDLVLVGGGGTIDDRRTRSESGMAFPMSGEAIRSSEVPLAFVAVGYNLFGGTRLRNADALARVLRACEERGFPFSVRNDRSLERLRAALGNAGGAELEDAARAVVEVPDPGFFVEVDTAATFPQFTDRRPRVLVQPAGDNPGMRLGGGGDFLGRVRNRLPLGLQRPLTGGLAELVEWLVERFDAEVVLAPHITTDLGPTAAVLERLPTRVRRKHTRVLGVPHPSNARHFFAAYAQADLVVGMRGHSVICSCGLGTPCVGLGTHPKVAGFMESAGVGAWAVEYGGAWRSEMKGLAEELLTEPGGFERALRAGTRDFEARLDAFLTRCLAAAGTTRR